MRLTSFFADKRLHTLAIALAACASFVLGILATIAVWSL